MTQYDIESISEFGGHGKKFGHEISSKNYRELKKTMFISLDRDGDREISFIEFFTKLPELMTFISQ